MKTIKDLVQNNTVKFQYFQDNEFWYKTDKFDFSFPVPISDTGGAIFRRNDKAILFMRWIRKHIDFINKSKNEHTS